MNLNAKFTDESLDIAANAGAVQIIQTVKPISANAEMTQPVGVDDDGKLFTLPSPDIATIKVEPTSEGALIKVIDRAGLTTATPIRHGIDGKDGIDGFSPTVDLIPFDNGVKLSFTTHNGGTGTFLYNGKDGADGKSAYTYAKEAGYTGTEAEFAKKLATDESANYVTAYGAKGDGVTDDTAAFKAALAAERVIFVPGGTYKLSSGITIGDNCCLELSQDTVLNFTNTEGNCITLGMISHLKGNHATVNVPYAFSGNVVYAYSNDTTNAEQNQVPPFTKWDPMWKSGRYVTDLNICKADHRGFHYLVNAGECKGTAVYVSAKGNVASTLPYMWGNHFSGLRIAGAFAYGIHATNTNQGWLHEMRMDAFIDACEIGVCLEECQNTYISAIIQPRRGYTNDEVYFPYAKNGIKLVRSKNTDLSGSRVWDWSTPDNPTTVENEKTTLYEVGNEYQHIAMIGNCNGTIINDYTYHEYGDTRERIYTDDTSNLDTLTILQEPIDKLFKMRDGTPYCFDGLTEKRLIAQDEMKEYFNTELVKQFTDVLPTAIDSDGSIYGEKGYKNGYIYSNGTIGTTSYEYYYVTGFFPCKKGSKIYVQGMSFEHGDNYGKIALYDANFNHIGNAQRHQLLNNGGNDYIGYQVMEGGYVATVKNDSKNNNVAYARISVYKTDLSKNPMISIDKEIKTEFVGFLADDIKVKGENVIGNVGEVKPDWIATHTYSEGAPVYDERNLFFEDASSAYLKDYGGGFRINIGIEYDVYWAGKRYTCEAKSYDGEPYLGNGSLVFGVDNTGEPFCLYGSFVSADTIAYVKKDNDETETISLKVTVKGEAEYSKMPKEYLPDDIGGSIDVTAEVGQTIIVKEVDASGKPTKWESAEYQPRTHWSEITELQPLTSITPYYNEAFGLPMGGLGDFDIVVGNNYKVTFDGLEYTCKAVIASMGGMSAPAFGNNAVAGGENTGEPFAIFRVAEADVAGIIFFDMNPHTIRIEGEVAHKIPEKYLPSANSANSAPFYIEFEFENDKPVCINSVSEVEEAFIQGRQLIVRVKDKIFPNHSSDAMLLFHLFCYARTDYGTGFIFYSYYSQTTNVAQLALVPNPDGTYTKL